MKTKDEKKTKKELTAELENLRGQLDELRQSEIERTTAERKAAAEALQLSETKYRSIFENSVEGIFQSTPESSLITVNPAMARIFGYESPEEMISQVSNIGSQLYTDAENRLTFEHLLRQKGIVEGFESRFYRKDGTKLWGSLKVRAVKDHLGQTLYYEGTLEDISGRKKAEEELKTSEEKYRNIFENAVEGIFQITPDGRYLSANPSLARIHGFSSPEEMIGSVTDIAHQLYVDPSRRAEMKMMMEEKRFVKNFEVMMRKKDMSLHWVSVNSHTVRDANGTVLYYEGTIEDITARKLAEGELKNVKNALSGMLNGVSLMVELKDPGITGHHRGVSRLAAIMAREIGFPHDTIETIEAAGMIHDIGKISVPAEILSKPMELSEAEYGLIKTHPQSGYDLLKDGGLPYPAAEMILQHHERLNGSGYPQGLRGIDILLEARLLAVADVVEAMSATRPHRPALGIKAALDEIGRNKGILYDPEIVDICLRLFMEKGFQFR